tara:strand:+ start:1003 stop:1140 length:138 start_codon:yes stop_codon:yes gene_type:complete
MVCSCGCLTTIAYRIYRYRLTLGGIQDVEISHGFEFDGLDDGVIT